MRPGTGGRTRIAALAALGLAVCLVSTEAPAARARVVLRWEPVAGAAAYELEIAKDRAFSEVVLRERAATAGYRWGELPATTYYWRVRSIDQDGRAGPWSEAREIASRVAPPRLLSPVNGARVSCAAPCSIDVAFEPEKVIEAYVLELSSTPGFEHPVRVKSTSPKAKAELPGVGTWYLRTVGVDLAHREVGPGEVQTLIAFAPAPSLSTPRHGAVLPFDASTPVAFSWSAPEAWTHFDLELRAGRGAVVHHEVTGRTAALPLKAPGSWSWRLRASLDGGAHSEWSPWIAFTVTPGAPALSEPADAASFGTRLGQQEVSLRWTGEAAAFVVQTSPDASFPAPSETKVACCEAKVTAAPGQWFWRVIPVDAAGHSGAPSDPRSFVVAALPPLPPPVIGQPAQGAVVKPGPVAFAWTAIPDAASYEVVVEPELAGGPLKVPSPRVQLSLTEEGTYRVRVSALDVQGAASPPSAPRELFVGPPPTARVAQVAWPETLTAGEDAELTIALIDALGRRVEHAPPQVQFDGAPATAEPAPGGQWRVRVHVPAEVREARPAELSIVDRTFTTREQIRIVPRENPMRLSLQLGVANSLGRRTAPYLGADGWYRLPVFDGRLAVGVRAGTFGGTVHVSAAQDSEVAAAADVAVRVTPVALTASYLHRAGAFQIRGGVGAGVSSWWMDAPDEAGGGIAPSGLAFAGVGRQIGPGVLALDASIGLGAEAVLGSTRMRTHAAIVSLSYGVSP